MYENRERTRSALVRGIIQLVVSSPFVFFFGFGVLMALAGDPDLRPDLGYDLVVLAISLLIFICGIRNLQKRREARQFATVFETWKTSEIPVTEIAGIIRKTEDKARKKLDRLLGGGYLQNCRLTPPGTAATRVSLMGKPEEKRKEKRGTYSVTCRNCGAAVIIHEGSSAVCEYCGTPVGASDIHREGRS